MAAVLHRTTLEYRGRAHSPDFPVADWVGGINPDGTPTAPPDLTPVAGVDKKYWKLTGNTLSEMTQPEKDAVDAAEAVAATAAKEADIKTRLLSDPLNGLAVTAVVSGLDLTVNIESLVVDDVTSVVADSTDTKSVLVCYVYDENLDTFSLQVFEKTTGLYADMLLEELLVRCLGEWQVVANGTELTEV